MPLRGGFPAKGWSPPPPPRGWFYPPIGSFGGRGVITHLWWFHPPFSVMLSVNLEPQYRKTSCLRSICCAVRRTPLGMGAGACPISISGMEVGEVMEGQGTTYGFTLSVLLHIALCILYICYRMFDLAGDNFTSGV